MKFLASEKLSAHRYKTPEGYLVCTDAILARTGKQTYRKNEIFDTQDDDEVEIDRPAGEVFNAQTVASFENKPVTVEHPAEDVNVSNYKEHAVGFARDIRRGTANGQDVLLGNLVITDGKTIEEIENGEHTELSCGYDCDVSEQDLVQRNIRGNHIALCEHGRAGIARIVDSDENRKAEDMVKHAVDKIGRKFTLEEKGGKIVATNESGRTKEYASWDEAEKEFSKRGIAIKDDFFGDELIESGSEEALRENIKTEIKAGKDPKQAAAIAYSVQRENDTVKDLLSDNEFQKGVKIALQNGSYWCKILKVNGDDLTVLGKDGHVFHMKKDYAKQNFNVIRDSCVKSYEVKTKDTIHLVKATNYLEALKKAKRS